MSVVSDIFGFIIWTLAIISVVIFYHKKNQSDIKNKKSASKKKKKKADYIREALKSRDNTDSIFAEGLNHNEAGTSSVLPETFFTRYEWVIAIVILLVGVLLRVVWFTKVPGGLNQDEASIGYEAWATMYYGIDRNGYHIPAYLVSWGSGQNALYMYLSMPFIWLFGLNVFSVRIVNLIFGLSALPILYLLIKRISGGKSAMLGLMLLAFSPWHIMLSRWGLESNLLPQLFLIAIYLFVLACDKKSTLLFCVSALVFSLCMYAYAVVCFVMPVFLLAICWIYYRKKLITVRQIIFSGITFVFVAVPIILFFMVNTFGVPEIRTAFMSVPKLPRSRELISLSLFGQNIANFLGLLFKQNEGYWSNTLPNFGVMYPCAIGLFFVGLFSIIKSIKKGSGTDYIMLIWMTCSVIISSIISVNINRINLFFIPFIYFTAEGIVFVGNQIKYSRLFINFIISIMLVCFVFTYFNPSYQEPINGEFHPGFEQAIKDADKHEGTIYLSPYINGGYCLTLFHTQMNPHEFVDTVKWVDSPSQFIVPESFGRYIVDTPQRIDENAVYVVTQREMTVFNPEIFNFNDYGNYCVVSPK